MGNDVHHTFCTSNHMFGRVIWDKLVECIFKSFDFKISNFQKITRVIYLKIAGTKHVVTC